jgi:mono/diheme cytochrome c family protein
MAEKGLLGRIAGDEYQSWSLLQEKHTRCCEKSTDEYFANAKSPMSFCPAASRWRSANVAPAILIARDMCFHDLRETRRVGWRVRSIGLASRKERRMDFRPGYTLAFLVFTGACAATSVLAGDAARGGVIAKRWCASCHVVAKDQMSANADAPSFFDVAMRRTDRKQIANFLVDPHPPMPNMHLSRKEIDDIVSYIRSLDPRRI